MNKLGRLVLVSTLAAGCGSSSSPAEKACTELKNRCDSSSSEHALCVDGAKELPTELQKDMLSCASTTDGCASLLMCWYSAGYDADRRADRDQDRKGDDKRTHSRESTEVVASACRSFKRPIGDCTDASSRCTFDKDCPSGYACNDEAKRCFALSATCVGSPCSSNSDCPAGERCNEEAKSCYAASDSQACMPCRRDSDCGSQRCLDRVCVE